MSTLQPLEAKLQGLIAQLSLPARKQLSRSLGRKLAQSQRQRIARQQNPDGTAFEPRKVQARRKKGKIKARTMFAKLKNAQRMKLTTTANGIEIGYQGQNAHIARIHQFGLKAKVNPKMNWKVQYPQRELLGFSEQDRQLVEELVIKHLAKH